MQSKFVQEEKRIVILDLFKIVLVFLLVFYHYGPAEMAPLEQIVVPFFFASAGYFSYYQKSKDYVLKKATKKVIKSVIFYLVGLLFVFCISLLLFIPYVQSHLKSFSEFWNEKLQMFKDPQEVFNLFVFNDPRLRNLFLQNYLMFVTKTPLDNDYFTYWMFYGIGFFTLGYTAHQFKHKFTWVKNYQLITWILIFALLPFTERIVYVLIKVNGETQFYFTHAVATFFIMIGVSRLKPTWPKFTKAYYKIFIPNFSLLGYIVQKPVGGGVRSLWPKMDIWLRAFITFLFTIAICIIISVIYIQIERLIKTLVDKHRLKKMIVYKNVNS